MDRPDGLGDVDVDVFRHEAHRLVDWIADYLAEPERYPVLSAVAPGDVRRRSPRRLPGAPEPLARDPRRHRRRRSSPA